jgi:hypothetical protein
MIFKTPSEAAKEGTVRIISKAQIRDRTRRVRWRALVKLM